MMLWASVAFGALSAILWIGAAVIPPAVVGSYYGKAPDHITRRQHIGAFCNAAAAVAAALAMGCQAYATWAAMPA